MREQNHYLYAFGPFHLDATRRVLLREGQLVKLFPKEFDTLLALVERRGELLEKDELMRQVWPDAIVEESNLTTNISHLRKILGESRNSHDYIVTVPGRGYQFVAGVELERERLERSTEPAISHPAQDANTTRAHGHMLLSGKLLLSAVAVGLTLVTFVSYRFSKNQAVAFNDIKFTRLTNSGRATLAAMSPDGKYIVHASKDSEGESLWLKQVLTQSDVQIAPPAANVYWGLTFSPDGQFIYCVTAELNRGDTTLSVIPVLGGAPRRLPVGPHGPVSFSPDGERFAFLYAHRDTFHLYVANKDGGATRLVASRSAPEKFIDIAVGPAWSPDGKEIACGVRKYDETGYFDSVVAIRVIDGSERPLSSHRWSGVGQMAWLPSGLGLVVTARENPSTPFQIWHLPASRGDARRVTNDLNDYRGISYNAATGSLLAIQTNVVSGIWVMRSGDLTDGRSSERQFPVQESSGIQIVSETGRLPDIAWTSNGRIVYASYAANGSSIWVRDPSESTPRQLAVDTRNVHGLAVSPDGRYLVLSSDRAGTFNLWRMDLNGGELVQLTNGEDVSPRFSPDGRWVVFQRGFPTGARIWRVSRDGGEAVPLTQTRAQKPDVSRDGNVIAYHTLDSEFESSPWIFGVMAFDGGPLIKRFSFPSTVTDRMVRWVPGGWGLAYLDTSGGVSNVWVQPLDGRRPWQLSNFKSERIDSFEWSPDARWLAAVRSSETSDVVLMQPVSE